MSFQCEVGWESCENLLLDRLGGLGNVMVMKVFSVNGWSSVKTRMKLLGLFLQKLLKWIVFLLYEHVCESEDIKESVSKRIFLQHFLPLMSSVIR